MIGESIHSIQAPICSTIPRWSHFGWLSESSMPPVTRRGYNNEFKHEVKSVSMPLQGHRPGVFISHRGRDDLRVVRLNATRSNFQVCSLLPQVSVPEPQSPPTREGRPPRRPPQCRCRSTAFHLSRSAPLREPRHFMAHFPRGRDDLRVVRLNASTFQVCSLLFPSSGFRPVRLNALTLISSVSACLRVEPSA